MTVQLCVKVMTCHTAGNHDARLSVYHLHRSAEFKIQYERKLDPCLVLLRKITEGYILLTAGSDLQWSKVRFRRSAQVSMVLIFGKIKNVINCMSLDTTNIIIVLPSVALPRIFLENVGQTT